MTDEQQEQDISQRMRTMVNEACLEAANPSAGSDNRYALYAAIAALEGDEKRLDTLQEQDYVEFRRAGGKSVVRIWRSDDLRRQLDLWFSLGDPMSSSTPSTDGDSVSMNGENVDIGDNEIPEWVWDAVGICRKTASEDEDARLERAMTFIADTFMRQRGSYQRALTTERFRVAALQLDLTATVEEAVRKERECVAAVIEEHDWPLPIEDFMSTNKHLCSQLCREIARGVRTGVTHDGMQLFPTPSPSRPAGGATHG